MKDNVRLEEVISTDGCDCVSNLRHLVTMKGEMDFAEEDEGPVSDDK